MKINISKKEFRLLLDVFSITHWIMNSFKTEDDPKTEPYKKLEQKFYSYAKDFGYDDLIEYAQRFKQYFPTKKYEDIGTDMQFVDEYTKEAGVRQLERVLAKLLRKSIQELLADKNLKSVKLTDAKIEKWMGPPKYKRPDKKIEENVGMVTGLAWTEVGGDILEVEIASFKR